MKRASEVRVKKPYHAPKLIVYGDLTQLTMTMVQKGAMFDNPKHTMRT
jgi:hypothetical protein